MRQWDEHVLLPGRQVRNEPLVHERRGYAHAPILRCVELGRLLNYVRWYVPPHRVVVGVGLSNDGRADVKATGTLLVDCGKNMYCCGAVDASCCDDDTKHFFVDPENGDVKAPSKATGASASASPTWWTVDSKALLAATSMSSSSSTASASITQSSASEATGSTGSTTTSATATGATSTSTNTTAPAGEGESKGLSAGAGAGIGIGAAAAIALVGGLIWFLMKRKKKNNPYEAPADQHTAGAGQYSPTSYPSEHKPHNNYYAHESAPTGQVHNSAPAPQELDGSAMVPEMQGDSQRHMMR